MSVWLVVGDSELRALLLTIGEDAGIPVAAIEPDTVAGLLGRHDRPDAMLVTRSLVPTPLDPSGFSGIDRLAVASGEIGPDAMDGIESGQVLELPASLEDVERTLRWLADEDQPRPSSSSASSSRLA